MKFFTFLKNSCQCARSLPKHTANGDPVRPAEARVFKFLEVNIPTEHLLITNLKVPTPNGLLRGVNAISFGKYAVYLVDVRGRFGTFNVDSNSSILNVSR